MKYISTQKTAKELSRLAKEFNATIPVRKNAAGRVIKEAGKEIRSNHIHVMEKIIDVLSCYQAKANEMKIYNRRHFLKTHNAQISAMADCSKAAVMEAISRLVNANWIIERIRNAPQYLGGKRFYYQKYELVINENILQFYEKQGQLFEEQPKKKRAIESGNESTSCEEKLMGSVHSVSTKKNINSKIESAEENFSKANAQKQPEKFYLYGTEKNNYEKSKTAIGGKNFEAEQNIEDAKQQEQEPGKGIKKDSGRGSNLLLKNYIAICISVLWNFSRLRLYSHWESMAVTQEEQTRKNFSIWFSDCENKKQVTLLFNNYLAAIEYRAQWMQRKEDRRGKQFSPANYFNEDNSRGFSNTIHFWKLFKRQRQLPMQHETQKIFEDAKIISFNNFSNDFLQQNDVIDFLENKKIFGIPFPINNAPLKIFQKDYRAKNTTTDALSLKEILN